MKTIIELRSKKFTRKHLEEILKDIRKIERRPPYLQADKRVISVEVPLARYKIEYYQNHISFAREHFERRGDRIYQL